MGNQSVIKRRKQFLKSAVRYLKNKAKRWKEKRVRVTQSYQLKKRQRIKFKNQQLMIIMELLKNRVKLKRINSRIKIQNKHNKLVINHCSLPKVRVSLKRSLMTFSPKQRAKERAEHSKRRKCFKQERKSKHLFQLQILIVLHKINMSLLLIL